VLDTDEVIVNKGTAAASSIRGDVEFRNVWFTYDDLKPLPPEGKYNWILKDISFRAPAGKSLALVGATGAGKSSVISLVHRCDEYNKGEILVDGINVRDYELHALRKNIALVLQDVFLFSDSIFNNITLNDPAVSKKQVIEAAEAVGAHRFISRLPGGYD